MLPTQTNTINSHNQEAMQKRKEFFHYILLSYGNIGRTKVK